MLWNVDRNKSHHSFNKMHIEDLQKCHAIEKEMDLVDEK